MSTEPTNLPSYAICTPEKAAQYAVYTEQGHWSLLPPEIFWKDRYSFLREHGYLLRPRYNPTWTPSWLNTNRDPDFCEDSIKTMLPKKRAVMDATRLLDGSRVSIKRVSTLNNEIKIARYLSSDVLQKEPDNHCILMLDVLTDPIEPSTALMVMPYLRPFDNPPFGAIGEVLDFVRQTLEGLSFMHRHGVAHRDCAAGNIMMDARSIYPKDHHPVRLDYTPDGVFDAPQYNRIDHPVRYYFIDFGISSLFQPGESRLVVGAKGQDKSPPELSNKIPYDPFPLDVYILGHVYQEEFVEKYHGLEFLEPLISSMMHPQPNRRPTPESAQQLFKDISSRINDITFRWRLRPRKETISERVVYDTVSVAREGLYQLKRFMAGGDRKWYVAP
ncbi:hypothetical protein K474DRAFT_1596436 [Panus rudis PR-1116 ss-1]|nr:hypothetical protein K474DRAFT_1596436 [Panus rudis PR-1116 ss-1]